MCITAGVTPAFVAVDHPISGVAMWNSGALDRRLSYRSVRSAESIPSPSGRLVGTSDYPRAGIHMRTALKSARPPTATIGSRVPALAGANVGGVARADV